MYFFFLFLECEIETGESVIIMDIFESRGDRKLLYYYFLINNYYSSQGVIVLDNQKMASAIIKGTYVHTNSIPNALSIIGFFFYVL